MTGRSPKAPLSPLRLIQFPAFRAMLFFMIGLASTGAPFAQDSIERNEPEGGSLSDHKLWMVFVLEGPVAADLHWQMTNQVRWEEDAAQLERITFRPALGYQLDEHNRAWIGYQWRPSVNDQDRLEQRLVSS